jgi:putative endonuclease
MPWDLKLFFEVSENRGETLIVERFLKNQKSRPFIERMISEKDNPSYFKSLVENVLRRR